MVVIGGGAGALGTIEGLRESGFKGKVTVISKGISGQLSVKSRTLTARIHRESPAD